MWATIISFAIKIILFVIGKVETRNGEVIAAKKMFYEFIDHLDSDIPVKLNASYRRQLEANRKELMMLKKEKEKDSLTNS